MGQIYRRQRRDADRSGETYRTATNAGRGRGNTPGGNLARRGRFRLKICRNGLGPGRIPGLLE